MIPFNIPPYVGTEMGYVREAAEANRKICGDGPFTKRCSQWLEERFGATKALPRAVLQRSRWPLSSASWSRATR